MSARLRLTLSYAGFLIFAGAVAALGVYLVLRYVPNYPLTAANPRDLPIATSRQEILGAVVRYSALILGVLAVFGLAGGWVLAGWILRPLGEINAAARLAATGRLDHRIRLAGRSDEFKALADSFDDMLGRLSDAFEAQERFAANASHELRTPLAVTATLLDVARADPVQDSELLKRLQLTNARAIGLTEALLRLADANAVTAASEPVDLATIARVALADVEAGGGVERGGGAGAGVGVEGGAGADGITFDVRLEPAPATGDPALLGQLAANLVQNAVRHNVPGGHAHLTTTHDGSTVTLRVENDGARYSPAVAAQLVEPFLRGQGRTARDGYGLGLALVARIATLHAGTLTVTPRAMGGLVVTVTLPARP